MIKSNSAVANPMLDFLLVFNSQIWPHGATLREISLQNLSDIDFDFSRSLKVVYDSAMQLDYLYMVYY